MLTLHTATEETKLVLKWGGIGIGILLLLILVFRGGRAFKNTFFPTPPPPPTVAFGKLPVPAFPKNPATTPSSYGINTVTGTLPVFPDRLSVYQIIKPEPNLLALKRAQEKVSQIGFITSGSPISTTVYQWTDSFAPFRSLTLNILTYNFSVSSSFLTDPDIRQPQKLQKEQDARSAAESFISTLAGVPEDIDPEKIKTTQYTIQDSGILPATSIANTQVIRVDLYQKDINNLPIFYSNPPYSAMHAMVGEEKSGLKTVVEASFFHQKISSTSATYPIKTAQEAFDDLKKGNAYIVMPTSNNSVLIKDIRLAYYASDHEQDYLTPIVVFEGDNGFYGYVHAIKKDWLLQ